MTDKSQDSEKKVLSFKEQILRDLEEANEQILKIEKEYDLPDRSIETPSSPKEDEASTPPPKGEEVEQQPEASPAVADEKGSEPSKTTLKEPSQKPVEDKLSRSTRHQKKKKQNKIAKRIVRTVVTILLVVIVATGIFAG